jgi:hypothetical protein
MGTIIVCTLSGAVIGAIVAVGLYILGFGIELLNCACAIVTCNCDGGDAIPEMWSSGSFVTTLLFCTIAGAVIGLVYGIYHAKAKRDAELAKRNAENTEAAKKQRREWADQIRQESMLISKEINSNEPVQTLTTNTYKSKEQMDLIQKEIANATKLKGVVDSMADDIKKGGAK